MKKYYAEALFRTGSYGNAAFILRQMLDANPGRADFHNLLGRILYEKKDFQASYDELITSINLGFSDPRTYYLVARILYSKGRISDAVEYLRDSLKIDPSGTETLYFYGFMLYKKGDYAEASRVLGDLLKL